MAGNIGAGFLLHPSARCACTGSSGCCGLCSGLG